MRKKKKLTEDNLHSLLTTKINEPGIDLEQLYIDISKIHPKPKSKFYTTLLIGVIGFLCLFFVKNSTFCSIAFLLFIVFTSYCISLQRRHSIIEIHWSLMSLIALILLQLSYKKLEAIDIPKQIIDLVAKLFTEISGVS